MPHFGRAIVLEYAQPHLAVQRALPRAARLEAGVRALPVAMQVAWLTVLGWVGATITLLPLAFRGAPLGRSSWPTTPARSLPAMPRRETVPR